MGAVEIRRLEAGTLAAERTGLELDCLVCKGRFRGSPSRSADLLVRNGHRLVSKRPLGDSVERAQDHYTSKRIEK